MSPHLSKILTALLLAALAAACGAALSCRRAAQVTAEVPKSPSVRLYVASTLAGALEPCGCRKDMLGGVDHAAALLAAGKREAPDSLMLGAGPLFFLNPELAADKRQQDVWKAHSIAQSLADLRLSAWAPGVNDLAAGSAELQSLTQTSGAQLLAANVTGLMPARALHVVEVGGHKVGLAGVSDLPKEQLPQGLALTEAKSGLSQALTDLKAQGAKVLVALVAAQRGEALRLAEAVPGFHVMVVGKPLDRGEGNDAPTPPVLVGQTLIVQAPNHLQALAVVDLFVRDGEVRFADGSGIEAEEQKLSLAERASELERRIEAWRKAGASAADLNAREADLAGLKQQLSALSAPRPTPQGSFFRYELRQVRESLGSDPHVGERLRAYYKKVNDHNREALSDRKPLPAPAGQAHYVGVQNCASCHQSAFQFWQDTRHAHAYQTLATDFKEFNLDCVGCHVTGYERPGGSTVTFVENLKNVQCEECHGPGSQHAELKTKDSIRRMPMAEQCKKCHHPPHVLEDWDVLEAWKKVIGPGHGLPLASAPATPDANSGAAGAKQAH